MKLRFIHPLSNLLCIITVLQRSASSSHKFTVGGGDGLQACNSLQPNMRDSSQTAYGVCSHSNVLMVILHTHQSKDKTCTNIWSRRKQKKMWERFPGSNTDDRCLQENISLILSFSPINVCGHILNRFTAQQTNTVDRISISFFLLQWLSFGYSSRVCFFLLFVHF